MFHTIVYQPLYNIFILLADWLPFLDAGMLVILFTVIIRIILFPLSKKAYMSQLEMKKLQPKLDEIRSKYANEKDIQAKKIMEAYKEAKANPFSGILV
ncbi:MAG: YidC/Oxa1 family membrane protein insertase, partial [Minisyncoccia bacterium]